MRQPPLLAAALVLVPWLAAAKPPPLTVATKLSLAARHVPPTFYAAEPLVVVDRGRVVYLGRGAVRDPEAIELLDLGAHAPRRLKVPLLAYAAAHPETPLAPTVQGLFCYDTADGVGAVLVHDRNTREQQVYLAHWDLAQDRIDRLSLLATRGREVNWVSTRAVGYDPTRRECLVALLESRRGEGPAETFRVTLLAVGDAVRTITTFAPERKLTHWPVIDAAQQRVLFGEYAELDTDGVARAHVVDLQSGAVRSVPIPKVTYGLALAPDGARVYAYSNMTGELVAVALEGGAVDKRLQLAKRGHAFGYLTPETLLLVTPSSLHLLDAATLKTKGKLPTKTIDPSIMHVEGSLVLPNRLLLRAFDAFYVVDVGG